MYEFSMTFTRKDTAVEWPMTIEDDNITQLYASRQRALLSSVGVVGVFTSFTPDGMTARTVTVWESTVASSQFQYADREAFIAAISKYCKDNDVSLVTNADFVPDTEALKIKKLANRLSPSAAGLELAKVLEQ